MILKGLSYKRDFENVDENGQILALKGPKREIFGLGIFAQIRPIWIGDLGTRPKNPKKLGLGPYISLYFPRFLF